MDKLPSTLMLSAALRPYLRLLRELEGVDAVGEVGGERVVQLAQRLLQRLQRLLVLLQSLQLLLQTNLPVHRLRGIKTTRSHLHLGALFKAETPQTAGVCLKIKY